MNQQLTTNKVIVSIPLKNNTHFQVTKDLVEMYQATYPKLDIYQQLNEMAIWCFSNPAKRKTERGVLRFINSWLSRARAPQRGLSLRDIPLQEQLTDTSWAQ